MFKKELTNKDEFKNEFEFDKFPVSLININLNSL
jgi:hypothetical protein